MLKRLLFILKISLAFFLCCVFIWIFSKNYFIKSWFESKPSDDTILKIEQKPVSPIPPLISVQTPGAPFCNSIIKKNKLSYRKTMSQQERDNDFILNFSNAKKMLGISELSEIRKIADEYESDSWMEFSALKTENNEPFGVTLTIRVWVPKAAYKVKLFAGTEDYNDLEPYQNYSNYIGDVWFCDKIKDINNKAEYIPQTLTIKTFSYHAPILYLVFDYIFREGWYDTNKRIPIMYVGCGEDFVCADRSYKIFYAECLDFFDDSGIGFSNKIFTSKYTNYGDIINAFHVRNSSHKKGCGFDINCFMFENEAINDGSTNPISSNLRHYFRDTMHSLDARNLPQWVYDFLKSVGYRIPADWNYHGGMKDWMHIDIPKLR